MKEIMKSIGIVVAMLLGVAAFFMFAGMFPKTFLALCLLGIFVCFVGIVHGLRPKGKRG